MTEPAGYQAAAALLAVQRHAMARWEARWPRQLEIHPPPYVWPYSAAPEPDQRSCIFDCLMCAGRNSGRGLAHGWEPTALELLRRLHGRVPFTILAGEYTEPMSSRYFMDFLRVTKEEGGCVGVHTNGARLVELDAVGGGLAALMTLPGLCAEDFLSVSVYAGAAEPFNTYTQTRPGERYFEAVLSGIYELGLARQRAGARIALRVSYLGTARTLTPDQVARVVDVARAGSFDSVRVSVAFAPYDTDLALVEARDAQRRRNEPAILAALQPLLSRASTDRPYVFFRPEAASDVRRLGRICKCAYGYYAATISARGTLTKCATVTMSSEHDLGPVSADPDEFLAIAVRSQDPAFDPATACFQRGLRCDPVALDLNEAMSGRSG